MRTVIICRGMCCTRLAKAIDGSNEESEKVNKQNAEYEGTSHYDFIFLMFVAHLGFLFNNKLL